jgi:hypothetical protein
MNGRVAPILLSLFSVSSGKAFLGMCSMLRNEKRWVRSWIEWHLMVGVDHFFILDDKSDDGTTAILEEYSSMGVLTFLNPAQRRNTLLVDDSNSSTGAVYAMDTSLIENASAVNVSDERDEEYFTQLALDLNIDFNENTTHVAPKSGHIFENGEVRCMKYSNLVILPPQSTLSNYYFV